MRRPSLLVLAQIVMAPRALFKFYFKSVTFKITSHLHVGNFTHQCSFPALLEKSGDLTTLGCLGPQAVSAVSLFRSVLLTVPTWSGSV